MQVSDRRQAIGDHARTKCEAELSPAGMNSIEGVGVRLIAGANGPLLEAMCLDIDKFGRKLLEEISLAVFAMVAGVRSTGNECALNAVDACDDEFIPGPGECNIKDSAVFFFLLKRPQASRVWILPRFDSYCIANGRLSALCAVRRNQSDNVVFMQTNRGRL